MMMAVMPDACRSRESFSFPLFVLVLICLHAGVFPGRADAQKAVEIDAQIGGDGERTRFVAFLSKAVDFRHFALANPDRIIIDLPQTDIQVPTGRGRGLVYSARAGLFAEGKSRIVIDLAAPALVEKSEVLPPRDGLPARLVVDLKKVTAQAFAAATNNEMRRATETASLRTGNLKRDAKDKRPVIVLDPGHGGVDGGAVGASGTFEKDVTLSFSQVLKQKLEERGRYKVVLTRTIDVFVPLDERTEIATALKADLFISLHADALDPKNPFGIKSVQEVRGATIYTLSEKASDAQAQAMAQRENTADIAAGLQQVSTPDFSAELEQILNDLDNRIKKNRSLSFANQLISQLKGKLTFNVKPHRHADFRVLKASGVPAVLFELGYLSNAEDEKLLSSPDWRKSVATEVASAIDLFMAEKQARLPF
jgi:N-acetylmuramoyl-L-alanine amidase